MPQTRRILKHVGVEASKGTRTCGRNDEHKITKGNPCLVIKNDGGLGGKCYCPDCAKPILDEAAKDLRALFTGLALTVS